MYDFFVNFISYILYSATFFLGVMMFISLRDRKKYTWVCIIVQWAAILGMSIGFSFARISISDDSWFKYVDYTVLSLASAIPVVFFYKESWTKLFYDIFAVAAVRTASAKLIACIFYFILYDFGVWQTVLSNLLIIVIYIPQYFLFARKIANDECFLPRAGEVVFIIIFTIIIYPVAYFEPLTQEAGALYYVYLVAVEVVICYGVIIFQYYLHSNSEKIRGIVSEEEAAKRRLDQYSEFQSVIDIMNRKVHDLKHQIRSITSGASLSDSVTAELEHVTKEYEAFVKTGNDKTDTILTEKKFACISKNIRMSCAIDGPAFDFLSLEDSNSLFGNLLDNAIEYLETVPDQTLRELRVRSSQGGGWLKLTVENYFSGTIEYRPSGMPKSTKGDRYNHGFGTASITKTAEKYGGNSSFRAVSDTFIAQVIFPVGAGIPAEAARAK